MVAMSPHTFRVVVTREFQPKVRQASSASGGHIGAWHTGQMLFLVWIAELATGLALAGFFPATGPARHRAAAQT